MPTNRGGRVGQIAVLDAVNVMCQSESAVAPVTAWAHSAASRGGPQSQFRAECATFFFLIRGDQPVALSAQSTKLTDSLGPTVPTEDDKRKRMEAERAKEEAN